MSNSDKPFDIEEQIDSMKKYIVFRKRTKIRRLLNYAGYFRVSRYGKYLLSFTSVIKTKPDQQLLYDLYNLDIELRKLFYTYCKKAELQFKSHIANSISLSTGNQSWYLERIYYTETRGEKDKQKRLSNKKHFNKFKKILLAEENKIRTQTNKYPEFKEYRRGGARSSKKLPCWAAFAYFDFGTITNMYAYLRGDLRKDVLIYGYSKKRYGKEVTKQVDTWLDAIRNLRNVCSHHNKLVGKTSSVVLLDKEDTPGILPSNTDLLSRMYALKKLLNTEDSDSLKNDLKKIIKRSKFDVYTFSILPNNWEDIYDRTNHL
ncbi:MULTISPECIES: Abi family protein [Bacillaceae]|uniref:Abortive phage infection protein n=1 Tax=Alkalicoccobacillus plakortidis TaxID=444060 RepID=A0A9D5I1M6_9BACI|nr:MULTISPECIES: Abi family protein [Bacillaceae]KQL56708.1 abortive phage infection protein [Alkalicoccobacillus plakortidis]